LAIAKKRINDIIFDLECFAAQSTPVSARIKSSVHRPHISLPSISI